MMVVFFVVAVDGLSVRLQSTVDIAAPLVAADTTEALVLTLCALMVAA